MAKRLSLVLLTVFIILNPVKSQNVNLNYLVGYYSEPDEKMWVDSVFNSMSDDEKLGQLFFVQAYSNKDEKHINKVEKLIEKYHLGGLIFFQGDAVKQAELTNRYQNLSKKVPLMIAQDAEWGLGMRLKTSSIIFPKQLMLGAIRNNNLIYDMGKEIAIQCRRIGVHVNFAPVVDVNNNPKNPVINNRSFGEDRYNVAVKGYMYMKGMQDNGVIACAKHFPGHGDTDVDSHLDLPVISHKMDRLDSIELFPFKVLIEQGVGSMMIAHLHVPSIDDTKNLPTTLSKNAVTDLLKNKMGYRGLIFTDALTMKGVTKHYKSGEVAAKAVIAGNDALLMPEDVNASFTMIKKYIESGKIEQKEIDEKVKKILSAKYRLGITEFKPIKLEGIYADLNSPKAKALKRRLIANSLTLVRNNGDILPIQDVENKKYASLSIGASSLTVFQKTLAKYTHLNQFDIKKDFSEKEKEKLLKNLQGFDVIFIGLHDMSRHAKKNFGLTKKEIELVNTLRKQTKVVLTVFGNPYSLHHFDDVDCVLEAYNDEDVTQDIVAQAIFGAIGINGKLPVTASENSVFGQGINMTSLLRLGYGIPEEVGINSAKLLKIDTLVQMAIDTGATPGCVVMVARKGKIVFHKAYGFHTYKNKVPYSKNDIFDLASVTKIAASTISAMKLHEQKLIDVYQPMSKFLPDLDTTNKKDITIIDMMTHHAGLKSWIKFYEHTTSENEKPLKEFYRSKMSDDFSIPVARNLFLMSSYKDSIRNEIYSSPLRENTEYKYSDLAFYLVAFMVDEITGKTIDRYAYDTFYKPLGLHNITYNPLRKFPKYMIPPTEEDKYFRQRRIHGYVHDMGAAMLGGVSGHAGLFSNTHDISVIMQMLLNGGTYGGKRFLQPETIKMFTTRCKNCTRRGIGFDMLQTDKNFEPNLSTKASLRTFGHLGFTGNAVWADPENDLIFILFSNRTYPDMHNNKFGKLNFRPRIQTVVYDALED